MGTLTGVLMSHVDCKKGKWCMFLSFQIKNLRLLPFKELRSRIWLALWLTKGLPCWSLLACVEAKWLIAGYVILPIWRHSTGHPHDPTKQSGVLKKPADMIRLLVRLMVYMEYYVDEATCLFEQQPHGKSCSGWAPPFILRPVGIHGITLSDRRNGC